MTGRTTGRKISLPVWFVREGTKLLLLPVKGSETNWYKNVLRKPTMSISASGTKAALKAQPTQGSSKVKYGVAEVRKYYTRSDACVELTL